MMTSSSPVRQNNNSKRGKTQQYTSSPLHHHDGSGAASPRRRAMHDSPSRLPLLYNSYYRGDNTPEGDNILFVSSSPSLLSLRHHCRHRGIIAVIASTLPSSRHHRAESSLQHCVIALSRLCLAGRVCAPYVDEHYCFARSTQIGASSRICHDDVIIFRLILSQMYRPHLMSHLNRNNF